MKQSRPIYLNLLRIRQPVPAVVSFLHRASGAGLFLGIPLLLHTLDASLAAPDGFAALTANPFLKLALFFLLAGYTYHGFAGLRFLLLDVHWGSALKQARYSAWAVLGAALASAVIIGIWLW